MTQSGPNVISGEVRSPAGNAVADARVFIVDGPGPFPDVAALSDSHGGFSLSAPAEGTYTVMCVGENSAPVRVKVSVPLKKPLQIELSGQS